MKRSLMASVVICSMLARASVSSQAVIYQTLDYPVMHDGYAEVSSSMFLIAGSAFDCQTGIHPDALMIVAQRLSLGSPRVYVPQTMHLYPHLYRPDIRAQYAADCPAVSDSTGYAVRVFPAIPPGYWRIYVAWANTPYQQQVASMVVEILP